MIRIDGELLADENDIEYSGVDIVRFGKDINQILYRETLSNKSVLSQYDKSIVKKIGRGAGTTYTLK